METATEQTDLSLPGYRLSTRLGAGGYGEVWLAHAPGGLTKAVKFIYGSFHEKRAEHELKALQRIKDLRHPFLLSLERIEVVDGRLVIVTELAESSLKDRFDECQRQGLRGVPREELLKYLADAADALDFLSEKHSLQHLDVKPENLLLVAGHVKVADFGLVKDIANPQASLVGGLTPLYSAPEVFQGAPSARSDQYSLAVLYQEMLTGVLPYPGVTAAELTMQHLHDEPDLSPLPTADRYVLARALAKEPTQRFASCTEMIHALVAAATSDGSDWSAGSQGEGGDTQGFEAVLPERRADRRPSSVTEFFDERVSAPRKEISKSMLLDWEPPADTEPHCLPAIDLTSQDFAAQPTLVIGVGGVAASVLRQVRLGLTRQYGDEPLAAVQLLLLDADPKTIAHAMQGDSRSALKPEETLALPLRRPQEYREQSARLMRWLSRRWLYNIPKSLRTEGLRPLGRLALADHARQAVQRIRAALALSTDAESRRTATEQLGLPLRDDTARVYVVASICGGVGSGMSLDVGYAVRTALEKANLAGAQVIGIFLHAAGQDPRQCDLARVNAYSWLTEYNHFHRAGGEFPGDESCGLPPLEAGKRAFDSAYLMDMDADHESGADDAAVQSIAEYICLDALTPAQAFFDGCRKDETAAAEGMAPIRTFTLRKIPAATSSSIDHVAARLSRAVVMRWTGDDSAGAERASRDTGQLVQGAATLVAQLQLQLEGLASNARALIDGQFGGDQQAFIEGLAGEANSLSELLRTVDRLFAPPKDEEAGAFVLQRPVEAIVSPLAMKLTGDLSRWVLQKLDDRQERLAGAHGAAVWLVDHLTRLEADASRLSQGLAKQVAATSEQLSRSSHAGARVNASAVQLATGYFRMRIDLQAVFASAHMARRLLAELKSVSETVAEFGRHLKHVALGLPRPEGGEVDDSLSRAAQVHLTELIDAVDEQVQTVTIAPSSGLFQTIMGNARARAQLLAELARQSQRATEQLAASPEVAERAFSDDAVGGERPGGVGAFELPKLLAHGGVYRGLAVVPSSSAGTDQLVAETLGADASVLRGVGNDVVLCHEAWALPLVSTAVDIIQGRRDYAEFASRVVTRSDIRWTPLMAPRAAAFPTFDDSKSFADAMPLVTQVL